MKHDFKTVGQIFSDYKVIHVPYYQRAYVWGNKNSGKNLYKFIDDIISQYEDDASKDYFIGTLAFCSDVVNDVIDGQQRLTSLVMILKILSDMHCSEEIKAKNDELIMPNGEFVIQEENYLTEDLKKYLGLKYNSNSQKDIARLSETVDKIKKQIKNRCENKQEYWCDGLYRYILGNVKLISIEYNNIGESVKYFLNINSLSIQLTQNDIFFSILSQSLRISKSPKSIFKIKERMIEIGNWSGMGNKLNEYKAYDSAKEEVGVNNLIYIFLTAYYRVDKDVLELNEVGVGKWLSFYKNEIFNDQLKAKEFTDNFTQYLSDITNIYNYLTGNLPTEECHESVRLASILLGYENNNDIIETLLKIFTYRHNYRGLSVFDDGGKISIYEINEIARRLNLTLVWNYIRSGNKRLDTFVENILLKEDGEYKKSIGDICEDIDIESIFSLTYGGTDKQVSNEKIADKSRLIKVILALQQAVLSECAKAKEKSFNDYVSKLLSRDFSVEHLYSINEYKNQKRRANWNTKKNIFLSDSEFDATRCRFENLSLLNISTNSSAGDDEIQDKLLKYKNNAKKIFESEWEYLILSLVEDSEYYRNERIQKLNLPERKIEDVDQNTWRQSENNREFNKKLLKMAISRIAQDN